MRNLKLVDKIKCHLKTIECIKQAFPDPNAKDGQLYLRTESNVYKYNCEDDSSQEILTNPAKIIDWEYLALNNEICVAREDGDVLVANIHTNNVESVTFCEGGIERMCWSPDQEVVVFVTSSKSVVVMNCTYDPISESNLDDEAFGDQAFINVGWGKKETQFHGSEGKEAAKKKSDFVPPENLSELDTTVSVAWRGDGEYFAVSYLSTYGRTFKVFNKEGHLQYTAEKLNNLGPMIAWRPSGNWIALPHKLPNKYTIGLFEKNGLRHREIVLPFKYEEEPVVNLQWSADSDILAIETLKDGKSNVYLYTIGNYHWYLKQSLNFNGQINMMQWDTNYDEMKTLHIILENGIYVKYRWTFEIFCTIGQTLSNLGIVGVIDGKKILLTDFRNNVIPPPMSKYNLETENYVNALGFINDPENPRKLFIVTSNWNLVTYSIETTQSQLRQNELLSSLNIIKVYQILGDTSTDIPLNFSHWLWLNDDQVVFCDSNLRESTVFLFDLNTENRTSKVVPGQIVAVAPTSKTSFVIHMVKGDVLLIDVVDNEFTETDLLFNLPECCEHIQSVDDGQARNLIALSDNQNLYLNDRKLASAVTSCFIAEHYFAYTQLTSIKFLRLDKLEDATVVSERRIERGAKIIVIISKDCTTVLQMPRGNLETIQPRVLSLKIIAELLDECEYEKAMLILRKQRINLNILFDHNPKKFIASVESFLSQISNPHWLNLFLTELENEDFSQTKYASNYEQGRTDYPEGFKIENKVVFLCDYLCSAMQSTDNEKLIQPIITCYVKKNELERALALIWKLKEEELKNAKIKLKESKAENALRYLLYMADVNELYDIALGMYNFQLVVFVASKSKKDPKEYIPFLNGLKQLEENYRKFKVDDHLKRYAKAFQHIANCGQERYDECLEYVQKHVLYTDALARFESDDQEFYKRIALSFADYLRTTGKLANAGVMYERGGDLKQAIVSAKHVLDVDRCLMVAKHANYDQEEMKSLAISMVPSLQANSRQRDAFELLKLYGDSFEEALNTLLDGRHYLKAIFEAQMHNGDLMGRLVKPHLESYATILLTSIDSDKELFTRHTNRLKMVRSEKAKKANDDDYVDEGDLISETTSVNSSRFTGTSRSSGKTFRSSKNRRKHERKLLNLKEGGKFEDIALIDALYKLVQRVFDQQQQIHDICKAFIQVRLDREGRLVQASYRDLLKTIKNRLDEIWVPEMMNAQEMTAFGGNIDYAQVQNDQHYSMIPPQQRFQPPLNIIDWEHAMLK